MTEEKQTVSLWLSERTYTKMLSLKRKIECATGMRLTHDLFIDTLLNYEPVIMKALDDKECS